MSWRLCTCGCGEWWDEKTLHLAGAAAHPPTEERATARQCAHEAHEWRSFDFGRSWCEGRTDA